MKIFVRAKPGAREEAIVKIDETTYAVSVREPPVDGRANTAILRVVARHFGVPAAAARIVSGQSSRQKVVEIVRGT